MSKVWEKFKALPNSSKAFCVLIPLVLASLLFAWYDKTPIPSTQLFSQATPIKGTNVTKTEVTLTSNKIKIIPKSAVKKSITPLPAEVDDKSVEVLDTAEVAPSENGTKVISVVNTETGETKIYTKENPPDLFAFENRWRVGVGYGVGTEGTTAKIFGEYTALRVGKFHFGVQSEIVTTTYRSPEAKVLAVIDYRNK
jgi:hypothetical protein